MHIDELDYELPPELIAQKPEEERDRARLLVLDRSTDAVGHRRILDLPELLGRADRLVVNDTRVVPARLRGVRLSTGARVEILLVRDLGGARYECLARPGKRVQVGDRLRLQERLEAEVVGVDGKHRSLQFDGDPTEVQAAIDELGEMPLPPYIRRAAPDPEDRRRYQTVFARSRGAIAAPTAGLHFTPALTRRLEERGVALSSITLHVGWGTFEPISVERLEEHRVAPEWYRVGAAAIREIAETRRGGGRVVAVGTTSTRALETLSDEQLSSPRDLEGETSLFIHPPFRFRVVDALLTNFHLPRSSLLALVAAFAGLERIQRAYRTAVQERYRFYSYGDAMLIL